MLNYSFLYIQWLFKICINQPEKLLSVIALQLIKFLIPCMLSPPKTLCPSRISLPMESKFLEGGIFALFCSLMYPQPLEECLAYSRCSINICLIDLSQEDFCFNPFFCLSKEFDDLRACRASHQFGLPSTINVNEARQQINYSISKNQQPWKSLVFTKFFINNFSFASFF